MNEDIVNSSPCLQKQDPLHQMIYKDLCLRSFLNKEVEKWKIKAGGGGLGCLLLVDLHTTNARKEIWVWRKLIIEKFD